MTSSAAAPPGRHTGGVPSPEAGPSIFRDEVETARAAGAATTEGLDMYSRALAVESQSIKEFAQ